MLTMRILRAFEALKRVHKSKISLGNNEDILNCPYTCTHKILNVEINFMNFLRKKKIKIDVLLKAK